MPLTPIFHPQEDWYQAMVTKNKGSLKTTNRQEEWYEEIVDSMASGGLPDTTSASFGDVLALNNNKEAVWATPSSGGGVLVVTDTDGTLDKTWQEIHGAMLSGGAVISTDNPTRASIVLECVHDTKSGGEYQCIVFGGLLYVASSADGYPVVE